MTTSVLIEARSGRSIDHRQFKELADKFAELFGRAGKKKQLFLLVCANRIGIIAALKAILQAGHAVLLYDPAMPVSALKNLIDSYKPEGIVIPYDSTDSVESILKQGTKESPQDIDPEVRFFLANTDSILHPDLAILLTTSGSTGNPRAVRLSHNNIAINTADIIKALGIHPLDRVTVHMPLAYSYGLSVVLTHLEAGAGLVLFEDSMTEKTFWQAVQKYEVTTFPGVPYHFSVLQRLGLDRLNIPALRTMTQAGGRMEPELVKEFAAAMQKRGGRFFVMYGQTEAAPRMTILAAEHALDKPDSAGLPMAHGHITIEDGEIIYTGPNVMMGYADTRADLARGDDMQGRLPTGDLGRLDEDGFLYVTGRKKRFAKIDGLRLNLDDIEARGNTITPTASVEHNQQLVLVVTGEADAVREHILAYVRLHPSRVISQTVKELPRLPNGKIDMQKIKNLLS